MKSSLSTYKNYLKKNLIKFDPNQESAMKIIDELEETSRGIYSGAIGYIDPDKNFDFNVVIRTIIYDDKLSKISVNVGSGITFKSDPEDEYEECLIKINALKKSLS